VPLSFQQRIAWARFRYLRLFSAYHPYPPGGDLRLQDMDDDVDDFEPLVRRLHSVGQQPVDHALQQRVLTRAHRSRATWLHSTKLKVAAAMAGGFMIGSVGLASAGALPGPAQDVARAALGAIGVDVPPGHDRYNGPECGNVTSHGQYVDAHPDDPAAGKSPCGKPTKAVTHPGRGANPAGAPGVVGRHGPPPWAGKGKDKDKDKDKAETEDSPASDSPAITPANPEQPTTTAPTVTEMPTITTAAVEPTATTTSTIETDTSTTTESTTSTTTTTEP
jgi:hypothetical protein